MTERNDGPDNPILELAQLRDVTPPASLVPGVMRRIAEPAPMTLWSWLRKRRRIELRVSPLGALGLALAGAGLVALVAGSWTRPAPMRVVVSEAAAPRTAETPPVVLVRFTLAAQGARKVAVAGDFNGWDPARTPLDKQDTSGNFAGTVRLPPGAHEYMFVVDGEWVTDPAAAERRPDGFGRQNAVLRL